MIDIALQPVANQELSIQLDERRYVITLKETAGVMAATIVRDEVTLLSAGRIVAGTPLLPYHFQQSGNFILTTEAEELPYYPEFGVTQFLVYVSDAEIEELRGA